MLAVPFPSMTLPHISRPHGLHGSFYISVGSAKKILESFMLLSSPSSLFHCRIFPTDVQISSRRYATSHRKIDIYSDKFITFVRRAKLTNQVDSKFST